MFLVGEKGDKVSFENVTVKKILSGVLAIFFQKHYVSRGSLRMSLSCMSYLI